MKLRTEELVSCAVFAALAALGAFIRIPLPVLPVPFTLQFLFTNLAGLVLGGRLGALAMAVYVFAGLAGAPLFTAGGGPGYIFQPTFGYLLGFIFGTGLGGALVDRAARTGRVSLRTFLYAGGANIVVVYLCGLVYYYALANWYLDGAKIGVWVLVLHGCLLTLPADIAFCILSAKMAGRLRQGLGITDTATGESDDRG